MAVTYRGRDFLQPRSSTPSDIVVAHHPSASSVSPEHIQWYMRPASHVPSLTGHTDVHFTRNDLGNATYPMCPGHELAGVVVSVGSKVENFAVGDHVGVGCFVDSCLGCDQCLAGNENYCTKGVTLTYGGPDGHGRSPTGSSPAGTTLGGYRRAH